MTKQEIRTLFKQKRLELSAAELDFRSSQISSILFSNFQLEGKTISLFLPIERHKEINTYLILEKGLSIGATVALPKTLDSSHSLKHYQFESHSQLTVNEIGIPEPSHGKVVKPEQFDFIFVPLLAFDNNGHRIGYGKGYYDRFLKKCNPYCQFIGLSLFDNPVEISDLNKNDIALNYCITPEKLIRFEQ